MPGLISGRERGRKTIQYRGIVSGCSGTIIGGSMNVTAGNWQRDDSSVYRTAVSGRDTGKDTEKTDRVQKETASSDTKDSSLISSMEEAGNSDFKMKASAPDDSVGQLAAELARAETKMDVLQVLGKATRALASLKMSAYGCEGKEAKKALQQIRRMEKLIKRIQKKVKNLGKEEELERKQEKAIKKQQEERAKQIREELRSRRRKRHRDEQNYALKELAQDGKEAMNETLSSLSGLGTAVSSASSSVTAAGVLEAIGLDTSSMSMDGLSIDLSV